MKTHESYVSLEIAKLLKKAGFDWKVQSYYSKLSRKQGRLLWLPCGCKYKENININQNCYSAPTIEIAQRWLREVKHYEVGCSVCGDDNEVNYFGFIYDLDKMELLPYEYDTPYTIYESALEAGIKKALEIILEKGS